LSKQHFIIKENSFVARLAALKLGVKGVAIVFGKTIYLHNTTRDDFLKNERWVKHELCHIRQFKQHGYVPFILKYVWESLRTGYYNNKYEAEARAAELL
jgi:hypothetical protein